MMKVFYKTLILSLALFLAISPKSYADKNEQNKNTIYKQKQELKEKQVVNITNDELILLSRLIAGEARGESYEGQLAVAAVVINRVKDERFPNNIKDVIYQKNAFSVVKNGQININPTESSIKAAQEALYGKDPTNDAIYFWNPDIATCNWIKKLSPYMRIGNHVFAK